MSKKILLAAIVLLILGGGAAGVWFLAPAILPEAIRPAAENQSRQAKPKEQKREPEVAVDLDTFVVNLSGPALGRYFRTSLSLAVRSEHDKEAIREFVAPIRHAIIMYLTARTVEELAEAEGKSKVRGEILKLVNAAIGKTMVHNVYFKEFLIQ